MTCALTPFVTTRASPAVRKSTPPSLLLLRPSKPDASLALPLVITPTVELELGFVYHPQEKFSVKQAALPCWGFKTRKTIPPRGPGVIRLGMSLSVGSYPSTANSVLPAISFFPMTLISK
jgi:hypothetical protein